MAVEIKATTQVQDKHLKNIRKLMEEELLEKYVIISRDTVKRVTQDGITIYPWKEFLDLLWSEKLI